jgi:predicted nucleotidyltransferase
VRRCFPRKKDVRFFIQKSILILSFLPFTYLFRKAYDLSIAVAVLLLKRAEGVLTIYLRRGAAKNEIIYGISDIDLLVIIDENEEKEPARLVKERIASIYNRLSRFIPLFGEIERELGIYSTSEFFELYQDYDFYKYRFTEGKYTWKLLFGKDLVKDLPELQDKELYLPATEELKVWWPLINIELAPDSAYPQFKRKDLWYKAISEVSKLYLFVSHGEHIQSREAALHRIKQYLTYEHRLYIDKVQNYRKDLSSKEDLMPDELMKLFIELSGKVFKEMERKVYGDSEGRKAVINAPNYRDLIWDSNVLTLIDKLETYVKRELEPFLDYVALIPQVEFNMDILLNSDIDSLDLVLVEKELIPVQKLRWFNLFFEEVSLRQQVEPFIADGTSALSLQAKRPERCIKSPKQCPLFFSLLTHDPLKLSSTPVEMHCRPTQLALPLDFFEKSVLKRLAKIDKIVSDKHVYRMKTLDFLRFFWATARTKLLSYQLDSDRVCIPVTSKQILEKLIQFSPGDAPWLNDLHVEYRKELLGKESEAYRYISNSVAFLNAM